MRPRSIARASVEEPASEARMPVLVVCAHGTDDPAGRRAVLDIVDAVRAARSDLRVEAAYVDVQDPAVSAVVDRLIGEGCSVVVVPLLLSSGYHVQVDVAQAVGRHEYARAAPALGPAPELAKALCDRLLETAADMRDPVVLAAAGSSRRQAADDVDRQAEHLRELWKGEVHVGYLAGRPSVAGVAQAHPDAAIASYLIGRGFFQSRLEQVGAAHIAQPLGAHSALISLVLRRFDEAVAVS